MLNIALFGPPGAGKGTQSEHLIKHFNLFYTSTGEGNPPMLPWGKWQSG